MCEPRKYGVILVIGQVVNARFRVKVDAWPRIQNIIRANQMNCSDVFTTEYNGQVYKTIEFSSSWSNFFKVRLAVNKTQQERLKRVELELKTKSLF